MIIKYPTGSYSSVLPAVPEDSTSVTFTISNNTPPRTSLLFPKIPLSMLRKVKTKDETSLVDRRSALGDLIFTITKAKRGEPGNNTKQYEVGQILEFDTVATQAIEPMLVADSTEIRHDTNKFDYEAFDISDAEAQVINDQSIIVHDQLATRLNELRVLRADAEIVINTNQKMVNEATRNITALQVIIDNSTETDPGVAELMAKFEQKRAQAQATIDNTILDANGYAAEADVILGSLRAVATVLK